MFCIKCGRKINENICPYCSAVNNEEITNKDNLMTSDSIESVQGEELDENLATESIQSENILYDDEDNYVKDDKDNYISYKNRIKIKSRTTAGILQLFFGWLGLGRFYLGFVLVGVFQIIASIFSCGIAGVLWGIIDGIGILNGTVKTDFHGNDLKN